SFRCFFPDGDSTTNVEIQVRDDDGALDSDSQRVVIVNVANVAPVLTPAADQNSNEGQNKPFDLGSFTDPGDDDLWTITVEWGDGSADTTFDAANPGKLAQKAHTYANDGNYTVTVTVVEDGGAASDSETFNVTVANVAPTVDLTGPNASNEGDTEKYEFTVTDPGDDTHTIDWDCGAGEKVQGSFEYDPTTKTGSFECRFPDGPVNTTVSVSVNDGDDTGNDSIQVSVANVAPVANDDQMTTTELKEVTGNLVDNDDDPGNDIDRASLEILSINALNQTASGPLGGVVTISNLLDGNVTYLPNRGFVDIDSFRYKVCDDDGDCSSANVEVTVGPVDCNAQGVILGTPGADILRGTPGNDVICSFGGNDRIYAGAGDDLLVAAEGLDRMWGEGGSDVMRGGSQTDAMDAALGDDYISGDTGRDVIMARGGNDYIDLKDNSAGDAANGGAGTDQCKKDTGDKTVSCELR
ncbi:MAG TPA: PKD domain-containing protein, partial [Rubrobacter sp.]|nr:PKD domain-containing protein [Rubrobacter sp.]